MMIQVEEVNPQPFSLHVWTAHSCRLRNGVYDIYHLVSVLSTSFSIVCTEAIVAIFRASERKSKRTPVAIGNTCRRNNSDNLYFCIG
jgi:hypothetical protein